MISLFLFCIGTQAPSEFEWSYPSLKRNGYESLMALMETNDLDFGQIHTATWWPENDDEKAYLGVRLRLSNVFPIGKRFAVVCLRRKTMTIPGDDIIRFILFTKEGQFLDVLTLDTNGRKALFELTSQGVFIRVKLKNFETPPSLGYYKIGITSGESRVEFGLAVHESKESGEARLLEQDDRFIFIACSY